MYDIDQTVIMGLDVMDPLIRELDMSRIGSVLLGEEDSVLGGPPVHAMLMQNINPAEVAPEAGKVLEGLGRDDLFLCVHEQFMTATAKYADILLPATMFLEHEDFYRGGGHVYLQVTRKVVEPPGECRSNHDVICELGRRLGADHPGFSISAWELIDQSLRASGLPGADEAAAARWIDCSRSFEETHFLNGFATPNGRFRFAPDWSAIGADHENLPSLPDHLNGFATPNGRFRFAPDWSAIGADHENLPSLPDHLDVIDRAARRHPYRLVTAPARRFLNTSFTEMPSSRRKEGRPTLLVHPRVCDELGLGDGARVRIGNDRGSVIIHAKPFDGLQPGVVVVEGIWPNAAFEEGVGINLLTSADRGLPNGGAVVHDTAVWLQAA